MANTTMIQAYLFASIATISTTIASVQSFELRELEAAYHAEQEHTRVLSEQLMEATAVLEREKDEEGRNIAVTAVQTLSVRNNNPLNVKTVKGSPWYGQIAVDKHGHAVFDTPEHGIRAGANVLLNYYTKHGLDTLDGILSRFCTGNRAEYAAFLSKRLGIGPAEQFNVLERLPELLHAMARFESGREWPRELFAGYSLVATAYQKGRQ